MLLGQAQGLCCVTHPIEREVGLPKRGLLLLERPADLAMGLRAHDLVRQDPRGDPQTQRHDHRGTLARRYPARFVQDRDRDERGAGRDDRQARQHRPGPPARRSFEGSAAGAGPQPDDGGERQRDQDEGEGDEGRG